jgi:putative addiction module component (TIGR02574 family)
MKTISVSDLLELSVTERILLVEDIWDSVSAAPESISLTDKQREELDHRLQAYHKDPNVGSPWEKVRSRIAHRS